MPEPPRPNRTRGPTCEPALDEELSRLPDQYRAVIVLCDLEGKTRKDVARQLGCPGGNGREPAGAGRTMLAKRLNQRGVALSAGSMAAALTQQSVSAVVPTAVVIPRSTPPGCWRRERRRLRKRARSGSPL